MNIQFLISYLNLHKISRKLGRFEFESKRHSIIQINTCSSNVQCSKSANSIKNYDSHNFTPKLDLCKIEAVENRVHRFRFINMSLNGTPFKHSLIKIWIILHLDHYLHNYRYCWSAPMWDRDFVWQSVSIQIYAFNLFPYFCNWIYQSNFLLHIL